MSAFEQVLAEQRAVFNARFYEARHFNPTLDSAAFKAHLDRCVRPIVDAAEACQPGRAAETCSVLYDLSLELFGLEALGPRAPYPAVAQAWRDLFPRLGAHLARDPQRVAGSLSNALIHLSRHAAASPTLWQACLTAAGPLCPDSTTLLQAGQVAAWRCGMAEYRLAALELLPGLPPACGCAALGLAPNEQADLAGLSAALRADPWLDPAEFFSPRPAGPAVSARLAGYAGGFRGFGGPFGAPPQVIAFHEGSFIVRDGEELWQLFADRFGQAFHRAEAVPEAGSRTAPIDRAGTVRCAGQSLRFPELAGWSGAASGARTLAVSLAGTHRIALIALTAEV